MNNNKTTLSCPKCGYTRIMSAADIPPAPTFAKCPKCSGTFAVAEMNRRDGHDGAHLSGTRKTEDEDSIQKGHDIPKGHNQKSFNEKAEAEKARKVGHAVWMFFVLLLVPFLFFIALAFIFQGFGDGSGR